MIYILLGFIFSYKILCIFEFFYIFFQNLFKLCIFFFLYFNIYNFYILIFILKYFILFFYFFLKLWFFYNLYLLLLLFYFFCYFIFWFYFVIFFFFLKYILYFFILIFFIFFFYLFILLNFLKLIIFFFFKGFINFNLLFIEILLIYLFNILYFFWFVFFFFLICFLIKYILNTFYRLILYNEYKNESWSWSVLIFEIYFFFYSCFVEVFGFIPGIGFIKLNFKERINRLKNLKRYTLLRLVFRDFLSYDIFDVNSPEFMYTYEDGLIDSFIALKDDFQILWDPSKIDDLWLTETDWEKNIINFKNLNFNNQKINIRSKNLTDVGNKNYSDVNLNLKKKNIGLNMLDQVHLKNNELFLKDLVWKWNLPKFNKGYNNFKNKKNNIIINKEMGKDKKLRLKRSFFLPELLNILGFEITEEDKVINRILYLVSLVFQISIYTDDIDIIQEKIYSDVLLGGNLSLLIDLNLLDWDIWLCHYFLKDVNLNIRYEYYTEDWITLMPWVFWNNWDRKGENNFDKSFFFFESPKINFNSSIINKFPIFWNESYLQFFWLFKSVENYYKRFVKFFNCDLFWAVSTEMNIWGWPFMLSQPFLRNHKYFWKYLDSKKNINLRWKKKLDNVKKKKIKKFLKYNDNNKIKFILNFYFKLVLVFLLKYINVFRYFFLLFLFFYKKIKIIKRNYYIWNNNFSKINLNNKFLINYKKKWLKTQIWLKKQELSKINLNKKINKKDIYYYLKNSRVIDGYQSWINTVKEGQDIMNNWFLDNFWLLTVDLDFDDTMSDLDFNKDYLLNFNKVYLEERLLKKKINMKDFLKEKKKEGGLQNNVFTNSLEFVKLKGEESFLQEGDLGDIKSIDDFFLFYDKLIKYSVFDQSIYGLNRIFDKFYKNNILNKKKNISTDDFLMVEFFWNYILKKDLKMLDNSNNFMYEFFCKKKILNNQKKIENKDKDFKINYWYKNIYKKWNINLNLINFFFKLFKGKLGFKLWVFNKKKDNLDFNSFFKYSKINKNNLEELIVNKEFSEWLNKSKLRKSFFFDLILNELDIRNNNNIDENIYYKLNKFFGLSGIYGDYGNLLLKTNNYSNMFKFRNKNFMLKKNYENLNIVEKIILKIKNVKNVNWNKVLLKDFDTVLLNILKENTNMEKVPINYPLMGLWHNYFNYFDEILEPFDWRFGELFSDWQGYIWYKLIPYFEKFLSYRLFFFDSNKDLVFCNHSNWEFFDYNFINFKSIFFFNNFYNNNNSMNFEFFWYEISNLWRIYFLSSFFKKMFYNKVGSWLFNCEFYLLWGNIDVWDDWWEYLQQDLNFKKLRWKKWKRIGLFKKRLDFINFLKGFEYSMDNYKRSFKLFLVFKELLYLNFFKSESEYSKFKNFIYSFDNFNKNNNKFDNFIINIKKNVMFKRLYFWKDFILEILENDEVLENFYISIFFINEKVFKNFLVNNMSLLSFKKFLKYYLFKKFNNFFLNEVDKKKLLKDLDFFFFKLLNDLKLNRIMQIENLAIKFKLKIIKLIQDWLWVKMFNYYKLKLNIKYKNFKTFNEFIEVWEKIKKPVIFFRALDPVWPLFVSCVSLNNLDWFKMHSYWLRPNMRGYKIDYKNKIGMSGYNPNNIIKKVNLKGNINYNLLDGLIFNKGKKKKWWKDYNSYSFNNFYGLNDYFFNKHYNKLEKNLIMKLYNNFFYLEKNKYKKKDYGFNSLLYMNLIKNKDWKERIKSIKLKKKIIMGDIYKNIYNLKIYKDSPYIDFFEYNLSGESLYFIKDFMNKMGSYSFEEFKSEEYLNIFFEFHNNLNYKVPFYANTGYNKIDRDFAFNYVNNNMIGSRRNFGMAYKLGFLNKKMYRSFVKNLGILHRRKRKFNYISVLKPKDFSVKKYIKKKQKFFLKKK